MYSKAAAAKSYHGPSFTPWRHLFYNKAILTRSFQLCKMALAWWQQQGMEGLKKNIIPGEEWFFKNVNVRLSNQSSFSNTISFVSNANIPKEAKNKSEIIIACKEIDFTCSLLFLSIGFTGINSRTINRFIAMQKDQ